jgi:hypothetical protein
MTKEELRKLWDEKERLHEAWSALWDERKRLPKDATPDVRFDIECRLEQAAGARGKAVNAFEDAARKVMV